jgi:hypothetical protein
VVTEFFDIAAAPTPAKARAGVDALGGPDAAGLHVYLGGHRTSATGWTTQRVRQYVDAGIRQFLLTYVGDQHRDQLGAHRGARHGRDAVARAGALGWTRGAPLVIDIEAHTFEAKPDASMEYVAGWCESVRAAGHRAGIYSSSAGVTAAWKLGAAVAPDFTFTARWIGHQRQAVDPRATKGLSATTFPRRGQRAWQYAGELRDGTKRLRCMLVGLDVDLDVADDGLLVGPPGERPRLEALAREARNDDVRVFQRRLRTVDGKKFAPLNPSGVTGFYGDETVAMCKAFQKAQGWTAAQADGLPGVLTLARLFP